MSLKHKIFIIISLTALFSSILIGIYAINSGKKAIKSEVFNKLTAIRELKANQIEEYFQQIENQVSIFSEDLMVIDAMKSFDQAFDLIDKEIYVDSTLVNESISNYYDNEFLPRLNKNSSGLVNNSSNNLNKYPTHLLQYLYISNNPYAVGAKHKLVDTEKPATYNSVHKKYHTKFKNYLEKFGYYDIFLVDLEGNIVYTVYKEVDFATSLTTGPFKNTNLAKIFKNSLNSLNQGEVSLIDFEEYPPSYNSHASFLLSPIFENNKVIGSLIFQLPIGVINDIMTDHARWNSVGLGASGETYLVGEDFKMRNQSRFLIEDKENYLGMLRSLDVTEDIINRIDNLNNSIGLQTVKTEGVQAALLGESNTRTFDDYRGVPVLSSYKKLKLKDLSWVIMSEIDKKEAYAEINRFEEYMYLVMIGVVLICAIISFTFSKSIIRPLNHLIDISRDMSSGNLNVRSKVKRQDEVGILSSSFNTMANSIADLVQKLEDHQHNLENKVLERTKELQNALERIELIINNSADIIITIDENHNITQFNSSAKKAFGYSMEEVLGKPLSILLPEKSRAVHTGEVNKFKDSNEISRPLNSRHEISGVRKEGTIFPIEATISKNVIDGKVYFTSFARDITVRKKMEAELENAFQVIKDQKERMEDELNVASEIQMSMLPLYFSSTDENDNVDFYGLLEAAREVGGDFFNHFFIDKDHLCFLVGDVSGKGVPAALLMSVTQALLKSESHGNFSTAKIVNHVNNEISKDNVSYMFVTLFMGILDLKNGFLTYTNAGHNPTIIKKSNGETEKLTSLHGPALGAMEGFEFKESQIKIDSKDFILAYTDGVTESHNNKSQLYTDGRLTKLIQNFKGESCKQLVNEIVEDVKRHENGMDQFDDITILAVKVL